MSQSQQKIVQYLNEAHATEVGLDARAAIADRDDPQGLLSPRAREAPGRDAEPRRHACRAGSKDLGAGDNPVQVAIGARRGRARSGLALAKTPLDLVRGTGGEEKVLKNAKDACATEALEIATYTALERLARSVGDSETAELAESIRTDEQRMLDAVLREIPKLTDAVVEAEVKGNGSFDLSETGAADATRVAGVAAKATAKAGTARAKRGARQARKVPGVAQAEGQAKGAVASEGDLAIARYDKLTADEIVGKLNELSQIDLAKVDSYERKNQNRSTVLDKVTSLRGDEPWPGYDELSVAEVSSALDAANDERVKEVRSYERAHKNRAGVLKAAEREGASA